MFGTNRDLKLVCEDTSIWQFKLQLQATRITAHGTLAVSQLPSDLAKAHPPPPCEGTSSPSTLGLNSVFPSQPFSRLSCGTFHWQSPVSWAKDVALWVQKIFLPFFWGQIQVISELENGAKIRAKNLVLAACLLTPPPLLTGQRFPIAVSSYIKSKEHSLLSSWLVGEI